MKSEKKNHVPIVVFVFIIIHVIYSIYDYRYFPLSVDTVVLYYLPLICEIVVSVACIAKKLRIVTAGLAAFTLFECYYIVSISRLRILTSNISRLWFLIVQVMILVSFCHSADEKRKGMLRRIGFVAGVIFVVVYTLAVRKFSIEHFASIQIANYWLSAITGMMAYFGIALLPTAFKDVPSDVKDNVQNEVSFGNETADDLRKYKELLDIGAITQEEFDTKKKEILKL